MGKVEFTGSWIFICNPQYWDIYSFLSDLKDNKIDRFDSWSIPDWQLESFKPGQIGIIRVGHDKRKNTERGTKPKLQRGVYAIVRVISYPKVKTNKSFDSYRISSDASYIKKTYYVEIEYIQNLLDTPLLIDELNGNQILREDRFLINGYQGSSIPLRSNSLDEILRLVVNGDEEKICNGFEMPTLKISETEKELIIKSRLGHSQLRKNIIARRACKCEICNVNNDRFLIVSHIKPWSASSDKERLDSNNVLLLCPNHDKLFDSGYITFGLDGKIVISKFLGFDLQNEMHINESMKLSYIDSKVEYYMKWHREYVFMD